MNSQGETEYPIKLPQKKQFCKPSKNNKNKITKDQIKVMPDSYILKMIKYNNSEFLT